MIFPNNFLSFIVMYYNVTSLRSTFVNISILFSLILIMFANHIIYSNNKFFVSSFCFHFINFYPDFF